MPQAMYVMEQVMPVISFAMSYFYKPCILQLYCVFKAELPVVPPLNRNMPTPQNSSILMDNTRKIKTAYRVSRLLPNATCALLMKEKPKFYMEMSNLLCFLCNLQNNLFQVYFNASLWSIRKGVHLLYSLFQSYHSCKWQTTGQIYLKDSVVFLRNAVFKGRLLSYSKSSHWSDHQLCNIVSAPIYTCKQSFKKPNNMPMSFWNSHYFNWLCFLSQFLHALSRQGYITVIHQNTSSIHSFLQVSSLAINTSANSILPLQGVWTPTKKFYFTN